MPKKTKKSTKTDKCYTSMVCHPSTWLIAVLAFALIAICGVSAYGFQKLSAKSDFDSSKLAVFEHIAESYIEDMEFTTNSHQPVVKQATGYGVSDEDGAFYITFDFAEVSDNELQDTRHGIIYFQWDEERGTYGHAFSYHDDDYHPGGTYIKLR